MLVSRFISFEYFTLAYHWSRLKQRLIEHYIGMADQNRLDRINQLNNAIRIWKGQLDGKIVDQFNVFKLGFFIISFYTGINKELNVLILELNYNILTFDGSSNRSTHDTMVQKTCEDIRQYEAQSKDITNKLRISVEALKMLLQHRD